MEGDAAVAFRAPTELVRSVLSPPDSSSAKTPPLSSGDLDATRRSLSSRPNVPPPVQPTAETHSMPTNPEHSTKDSNAKTRNGGGMQDSHQTDATATGNEEAVKGETASSHEDSTQAKEDNQKENGEKTVEELPAAQPIPSSQSAEADSTEVKNQPENITARASSPAPSPAVAPAAPQNQNQDQNQDQIKNQDQNQASPLASASSQASGALHSPQDSKVGSTVPGDGHICANCKASQTPLWRRGPNGQVLCNACGLYIKARNIHRPLTLKRSPVTKKVPLKNGSCPGDGRCNGTGGSQSCKQCPSFLNNHRRNKKEGTSGGEADMKMISCQNCGTVNTPLWRRDIQGHVICNACGLYNRMHKDGRPLGLQTAIVKRRKRNRSQSDEAADTSMETGVDSNVSAASSPAESQASSGPNTPLTPSLVPLQPRAMPRPIAPHVGSQNENEKAHNAPKSENANANSQRLCCSHYNPNAVPGSADYQRVQHPNGFHMNSGPMAQPPQQPYGYIPVPVPGMPLPGLHPGGHFTLGHLPPPITQLPYSPYAQQQLASLTPPPHQSQQVPSQAPSTAPPPSSSSVAAPRVGLTDQKQTSLPAANSMASPSHGDSPNASKRNFSDLNDDQGDSPLAVLQYLKEASQDTKKEYLLAAQRQLMDKVAQYKRRLEVAEYQLGLCDNALKTINQGN